MSFPCLDPDCLAYVVNHCHLSSRDVASIRLTCSVLKCAVDNSLQYVEPVTGDGEALGAVLGKFPALKHLALGRHSG